MSTSTFNSQSQNVLELIKGLELEQEEKHVTLTSDEMAAAVYPYYMYWEPKFHRHDCDQIFYVLEGEGVFVLKDDDGNEEKFDVTVGSHFVVPKNVWHGMYCKNGDRALTLQVNKKTMTTEKLDA
ncbi:cupin domain-containing protein [Pseudalkalibacillus sp. SCS-8]|uniref:cupin domain-containing protein n=1 Tax=Pseudalkalibacillus nanhaiensis TaxID=3115291 RepID=UPI0032DB0D87